MNITGGAGREGRVTHDKSASKPTTRQDIGHRFSHSHGTQSDITICVICVITITNHYHYDVRTRLSTVNRLNGCHRANHWQGLEEEETSQSLVDEKV